MLKQKILKMNNYFLVEKVTSQGKFSVVGKLYCIDNIYNEALKKFGSGTFKFTLFNCKNIRVKDIDGFNITPNIKTIRCF